jgi:hypothetical protein
MAKTIHIKPYPPSVTCRAKKISLLDFTCKTVEIGEDGAVNRSIGVVARDCEARICKHTGAAAPHLSDVVYDTLFHSFDLQRGDRGEVTVTSTIDTAVSRVRTLLT